jgi:hypothetical protein
MTGKPSSCYVYVYVLLSKTHDAVPSHSTAAEEISTEL